MYFVLQHVPTSVLPPKYLHTSRPRAVNTLTSYSQVLTRTAFTIQLTLGQSISSRHFQNLLLSNAHSFSNGRHFMFSLQS